MDLKDLDTQQHSENGFELELVHPVTGAPLGMFITVLGRDSDAYGRLLNEQNRRRLERAQKTGSRPSLTLEELERDAIDLDAACTRAWRSGDKAVLLVNGEELACTRENAAQLYAAPGLKWVREQVDAAIVDRANFLTR